MIEKLYRIISCDEYRNIEVIKDAAGNNVDLIPDNHSYKGKLVLESDDGQRLEFKLAL